MVNIKRSNADCSKCKLLDFPSCILETNCKDDLTKVDVIFIAENPGKDEIKKGMPLIGKAGQLFRKYFKKYEIDKMNYLITNTVLCQTILPDGKTGNPDQETIDLCKVNCFDLIETCNPKLIVVMGTTPMSAFDIAKSGVTNLRGQIFDWREFKVLLTVHPSFITRGNWGYENKFGEDFRTVVEVLTGVKLLEDEKMDVSKTKGTFYYKIPDKFYTDEYRLVDVQFLNKTNEVLYIFRDKDNKRIYHKMNDDFYCYQSPKEIEPRILVDYKKLNQVKVPYRQKTKLDPTITYEGDMRISVKHAIDYYLKNKGECVEKDLNILYVDIEVYSHNNEFPNTEEAKHPICMITYEFRGNIITYVIDHNVIIKGSDQKIEQIPGAKLIVCKSEKELVSNFVKDLRKLDYDIISGWHVIGFDLAYIYNRCKKIGIPQSSLSRFNECHVDGESGYADIAGTTILDQLILYKNFTFGQKENYKLGTIAKIELGSEKLDGGKHFSDMYRDNVNDSIKYNIRDVTLLVDLENKVKHITLQNELKKICKSTFRGSATPFGQLDALAISYLKERDISSRNANPHGGTSKFEGAFVKEPIKGIHDWIVDFDFTSLYPSLILTYNIGLNTFIAKFEKTEHGYYLHYNRDKLPDEVTLIVDPTFAKKKMKIKKEELFKKIEKEKTICTINGCFFKQHDKELSFYSEILDTLLSSRKEFKKKMFDAKQENKSDLKDLYNTRQMVFKILANAMYGVLGNSSFRFFDRDCARSVTLSGQEVIKLSILEGNNFVNFLQTGKHEPITPLTVQETYEDLTRETPYVITGDTDSLFITYNDLIDKNKEKKDIINDVNKWNEQIENYLNNKIIPQIVTTKNVDIKYNRLNLKNELVMSRGIFLAKKRYSTHVITQEGNETDEIDTKGLEIKRSDFSSYSKESLQELLDIILKSEKISLNKINKFVVKKEREFIKRVREGSKTIARPVSFTKRLKDYKMVPQGVRGMLAWNSIVYEHFEVGSRGYLFKIAGIDLDKAPKDVVEKFNKEFIAKGKKLEVIVVPDEEEKLPDYFIPNLKENIKFAWTDRYNLLLEPIMEVKAKQEILTF